MGSIISEKVDYDELTKKVNRKLGKNYSKKYISECANGWGSTKVKNAIDQILEKESQKRG